MAAITISAQNQWTTPVRTSDFSTCKDGIYRIPYTVKRITGASTIVRLRQYFPGQSTSDAVYSDILTLEADYVELVGDVYLSIGVKTGEFTTGESLMLTLGGL